MAATVEKVVEAQLVEHIRDALQRDLIDNVPSTDPARPRLVVLGKYDGEYNGIVLSVHADHPLGFNRGRLNTSSESSRPSMGTFRPGLLPLESTGGSRFRHIFGTVQVRSVLDGYQPSEAIAILALVKVRVAHCINLETTWLGISDAYGYSVYDFECTDDYGYSSGGSGTAADVHWIDWIAHCQYPNRRSY